MAAPLTIEQFDISDSFISEPYLRNYGLTLTNYNGLIINTNYY